MKIENAILINPFAKSVTLVPYEYGGSYKQISEYISTPEAPNPLFTCVGINKAGDSIFVDDEGLYREVEDYRNNKMGLDNNVKTMYEEVEGTDGKVVKLTRFTKTLGNA